MRVCSATLLTVVALLVAHSAQAQKLASATNDITSFGDVAGSYRGLSKPSGIDITISIGQDGSYQVASPYGTDKGKASIKDGVLVINYSNNSGGFKFNRAGPNAIEGSAVWVTSAGKKEGTLRANLCTKPDCTDMGPRNY